MSGEDKIGAADTWDPSQYERFRDERSAPFWDLAALVEPRPALRVLDLGCGTGELTRALHRRLGARETIGVDLSAAMLARAPAGEPGLSFRRADIAEVVAEGGHGFDLVFSNAALHWVDDHPRLVAALAGLLAPGGQLAVQVPANHDHASHRVADELAGEPPFAAALDGWRRGVPVLDPAEYARLLHAAGFGDIHVRLQVYGHLLDGPEGVAEWVKGTLLTAYRERLGEALWPAFVAAYRARIVERLGAARPFFFTFKRILFRAVGPR